MLLKNATMDVLRAKKIVAKLKLQSVKLTFKSIGNMLALEIIAYSDVSFANLKDRKSKGGYVFIKSKGGFISPLPWRSIKIKRKKSTLDKSTLATETLALDEAADQCFYLGSVLNEVF